MIGFDPHLAAAVAAGWQAFTGEQLHFFPSPLFFPPPQVAQPHSRPPHTLAMQVLNGSHIYTLGRW